MDFSFVHAADLHLDTPFKGIGEVEPRVAAALRDASLTAFDRLIQTCLDRDAAFLVIGGDVYDGAERGVRAQLRFRHGLARLSDAGIPSFVVHGNHDPVDGWSAVPSWPPLVTVFGTAEVGSVPVTRDGEVLAIVHGISYWRRDVKENLALRFHRSQAKSFEIGLLHCNVSGAADGYDEYSPCTLADLCRAGLDYWALGHIHSSMVLSGQPHGDEPWVVYPGNLQARSPKSSERGAKGAVVVHVSDGRVRELEAVACDLVRFADVELDLGRCSELDDVRAGLEALAAEQLEAADGRSVVLRGRFVGRSAVHRGLARRGAVDDLLSELRERWTEREPFCWWERLVESGASPLDVNVLRSGSDFASDLVRMRDQLAADPGHVASIIAAAADGLPKSLQARVAALTDDPLSILEPALVVALDELGVDA